MGNNSNTPCRPVSGAAAADAPLPMGYFPAGLRFRQIGVTLRRCGTKRRAQTYGMHIADQWALTEEKVPGIA